MDKVHSPSPSETPQFDGTKLQEITVTPAEGIKTARIMGISALVLATFLAVAEVANRVSNIPSTPPAAVPDTQDIGLKAFEHAEELSKAESALRNLVINPASTEEEIASAIEVLERHAKLLSVYSNLANPTSPIVIGTLDFADAQDAVQQAKNRFYTPLYIELADNVIANMNRRQKPLSEQLDDVRKAAE